MILNTERIENVSQKFSGLNFMKIRSHVGLLNAYRQTDRQIEEMIIEAPNKNVNTVTKMTSKIS